MNTKNEELKKNLPENGPNINEVSKYINKYKDNKKLFIILSKITDIFKTKKIVIQEDNLVIDNNIVGNIKIQKKKIMLYQTLAIIHIFNSKLGHCDIQKQ